MPSHGTTTKAACASTKSHYETPVLKITVGEEEAPFNVNVGLLQGTSFFAKHGPPAQRPNLPTCHKRERSVTPAADRQRTDGSTSPAISEHTEPEDNVVLVDLTDENVNYVLQGQYFHTREAFAIFVRSLNDAPLLKPEDQQGCRALFQAYALGQQYDSERLQNQVIDALQSFYISNAIPVSDIIYLVEHWGDEVECFLAGYLITQAGYEMASDWPTYRSDNSEMEELFASGNRVILEHLFSAVAQTSQTSKDPAKDKRAWRFTNA